jgi:hypothetical protein
MTGGQVLAAGTAIVTIGGAIALIAGGIRTGLGWLGLSPWSRRRRLAAALRTLGMGQTLHTVTRALGDPPVRRVRDAGGLQHTLHCGSVDVVLRTDDDDAVTAYTVIARDLRFHPRINLTPHSGNPLIVELGVTTFADLGTPDAVSGYLGASTIDYRELHYHGRPGDYHFYVVATDHPSTPSLIDMLHTVEFTPDDRTYTRCTPSLGEPPVQAARRATAITRYGVIGLLDNADWLGV